MRTKREKANDRRILAGAGFIFAVFATMLFTACAPLPHDPRYDGDDLSPTADTQIHIVVENYRTNDDIAPTIYLMGLSRHSLGRVEGMGGKLSRFIDRSWLASDGCMTITAHYAGEGDLTFETFCWRPGQMISVSLDNIFIPAAAWAHHP